MNMMDQWFNWVFRTPFSGNVDQNIAPNFLSPNLSFNFAGEPEIETEVVQSVASYGKQLGLLTRVVLEMAENSNSPEVAKLKALQTDIEAVKQSYRASELTKIESILEKLPTEERSDLVNRLAEKYVG